MCDTTPTTTATPAPENPWMHNGVIVEYIEGEAFIIFDKATESFIHQQAPGKLSKNLYDMVLTLLQHQTERKQPVSISDSLYDLRQLLKLLEHADNVLQTEQKDGHESDTYHNESVKFLEKATDFVYDHHPAQLSHLLCRLIIELLQYELPNGYPAYLVDLLPAIMGLFKWLNEGVKLLKSEPTGGLSHGR